jgi:alkylated DNA repair dioxygenase AlkB
MSNPLGRGSSRANHLLNTSRYEYQDRAINLDFYPTLYTMEDATKIYHSLKDTIRFTREIVPHQRRNQTYGDDGLVYSITFGGYSRRKPGGLISDQSYGGKRKNTVHRVAKPWSDVPILLPIKQEVEAVTGCKYNFCVAQYYPSGRVGINPHRDKEMVPGTTIVGLSFGQTRKLSMGPPRFLEDHFAPLVLDLLPGSMYVFHPPTNDWWSHSIVKDESEFPRISLTFRNVFE